MNADAGLSLLLDEEFDATLAPPRPDLDALLAAARAEARAGICAGCDARAAAAREALAAACTSLAAGLDETTASLDTALAQAAHTLAETMLVAIGTALPGWQAQLDRTALADIATTLLAALGETVSPRLAAAPDEVAELRARLPPTIELEADAAMRPGALRLAWRNGRAIRDPLAIWSDIRAILAAALTPTDLETQCNDSAPCATE